MGNFYATLSNVLEGFGFLVGGQKNPQEKIYCVGGVERNIIISLMLGTLREAR
jgi:hypothetical protein